MVKYFVKIVFQLSLILRRVKTHSPHPPFKYKSSVPSKQTFEARTFENLEGDHKRFIDSGKSRSHISNYNNCEFESLFQGTGKVINTVSCMLLHISLGMGLKILNIIEQQTVIVADKIKEDKGQQTPELMNIMSRLNNLSSAHTELTERVQYLKEKVEVVTERKDLFQENNSTALRKIGRKFIFNTPQAKKIQADHRQICSDYKSVGGELKTSEKELVTIEKELESVEKSLINRKVFFKQNFIQFWTK